MERQIIHLENDYIPFKNYENNSVIETKFDKYSKKVSMFETVKEVGEEINIEEDNILLTR